MGVWDKKVTGDIVVGGSLFVGASVSYKDGLNVGDTDGDTVGIPVSVGSVLGTGVSKSVGCSVGTAGSLTMLGR